MQRKLLNARIKWAEASGRHQTMLDNVRALIKEASDQGFELTSEERNLVSFAYKNVVSQLRQQWRTLVQTELSWMDGYDEGKGTNNGKHSCAQAYQSVSASTNTKYIAARTARAVAH